MFTRIHKNLSRAPCAKNDYFNNLLRGKRGFLKKYIYRHFLKKVSVKDQLNDGNKEPNANSVLIIE